MRGGEGAIEAKGQKQIELSLGPEGLAELRDRTPSAARHRFLVQATSPEVANPAHPPALSPSWNFSVGFVQLFVDTYDMYKGYYSSQKNIIQLRRSGGRGVRGGKGPGRVGVLGVC